MASCIVDTSVWIDFFRGTLSPALYGYLSEHITLRLAAITDVIRHELLVGTGTKKAYAELQRLLSPLECLRIAEGDAPLFDEFAWDLRHRGFKGKYTDAAIAFLCHHRRIPLLTFDRYFTLLERKGIIRCVSLE